MIYKLVNEDRDLFAEVVLDGYDEPGLFMRPRYITVGIVVVGLSALILMVAKPAVPTYRLELRAYFADARKLKPGADVRIAGVRVGSVKSVQARPELKEHPAEVVFLIETAYPLHVPNDAKAAIETAGILGDPFVDIDVSGSKGAPLANGGTLPTKPAVSLKKLLMDAASTSRTRSK